MKYLLTPMLMCFLVSRAIAQCEICDQPNLMASISAGSSKAGYNQTMELGDGSLLGNFGIFAGVKLASEFPDNKNKNASTVSSPIMDPYLRLTYKTISIDDKFFLYNTISASLTKDIGASCRLYYRVGWKTILGVEPFYGTRTGIGVAGILTYKIQ